MPTRLHADFTGLLRAFIMLKWNVSLQGMEGSTKEHFQTYLAPNPFLQEHPLGPMCPRAHFENYCFCSHGESLKAFKQTQKIEWVFRKTVGWTGGAKTEAEKSLGRLN